MATLNDLKCALWQAATMTTNSLLSDAQYSAGFENLFKGCQATYRDFITPQLSQLLHRHFKLRTDISVLEIGPGPRSVLACLSRELREKVQSYDALEPNGLFASRLERQLHSTNHIESALPCLSRPAKIWRHPLTLKDNNHTCSDQDEIDASKTFDLILFCHSMYGMKPKHKFIERALNMLSDRQGGGIIVIFHRDGVLCFDHLVSSQTASYPNGVIRIAADDNVLDSFASFIAGYALKNTDAVETVRMAWRSICRNLSVQEKDRLSFSSPEVMLVFTPHATALPELMAQMPLSKTSRAIKNRKAHFQSPAYVATPTNTRQIQACVRWALKHSVSLAVIGGGHSGHCVLSGVVSIDMSTINQVHVVRTEKDSQGEEGSSVTPAPLVVVEVGSTVGDIIRKTMAAGLTVPLGARPSVGAGLWLQGGLGHLARLHGLSCDAIIGAVIVSVQSGQILHVGNVPSQYRPPDSTRPSYENDLLWAIKGAGTNFGIVVSVTFRAHAAATFVVSKQIISLGNKVEARNQLHDFDALTAGKLSHNCSTDAYLYWNDDRFHLGVTTFHSYSPGLTFEPQTPMPTDVSSESRKDVKVVDGVELFDTEMYMTDIHGGHGGGKTSAFKRCVFLKDIGQPIIAACLVASMESRPSDLCYLHLLQGGGRIGDLESDATAFGCRDWDFVCVITGVWQREQDNTQVARLTEQWVYDVAADLLPLSCGVYGADLGPDPRDAALAAHAFGPNLARLARLKDRLDPQNVLAYACPLPLPLTPVPKLIILVTGQDCVGKDYSAEVWASVLSRAAPARTASISDATKRKYAAATHTDLHRLLEDRAYKEQHRPALTRFFQDQVKQRLSLPQKHFLDVVQNAVGAHVLLITGMRDAAPVATLCYLVPESRLIEVHVRAAQQTLRKWRGSADHDNQGSDKSGSSSNSKDLLAMDHCPTLIFDNDTLGGQAAQVFAEQYLLRFLDHDLKRLADMVRAVHDFPNPGIEFRHVLGISEHPDGLALCTTLLQKYFTREWTKVGAIIACEAGGFIYASPLAMQTNVPLTLIRQAGKLPPPTISNIMTASHISSMIRSGASEKQMEIGRDVIPKGVPVLVLDDVLSTGKTLCAVLELLAKAGIATGDISVMVVAEFPFHRGRELLLRHGFGRVSVQSLLVLPGA